MTPQRWQQVKEIFESAQQRLPYERARFVVEACAGDEEMRREVESLLSSYDNAENFMEQPAIGEVADMVEESKPEIARGQRLGYYEIIAPLGAGGMGQVFLATDTRLKRKVALKLLPNEYTADKILLRRFEQEAQTASALNHPNIITIYEVSTEGNLNFIATEFIDGQTLRQKLRGVGLPFKETLEIAQQVASALVAAHQAGIVHRDIKPENIMIRPDGLVKVLDFGIAKLSAQMSEGIDREADTINQGMTQPGIILGTLHYMSPEQVRGLRVDARSDIFSVGTVLYEMLTGQGPFVKPTKSDVIAAILQETPPPLAQVRDDIPTELQRIVTKALQKDNESRYQTSKDLLLDLKSLSKELEITAHTGRISPQTQEAVIHTTNVVTTRRFSLAQTLALLLAVGLAISAAWWFAFKRNAPAYPPSSLKTAEVATWRSAPGELYSIGSFSPDGARVAFVTTGSGSRNIYFKQTATNAPPFQITKDEFNNDSPMWSPDGEEIAFFSTRGNQPGLWRIPYLGGSPMLLKTVQDGDTRPKYWSKNGTLYYEEKQNLFALDMKSGQTANLTNLDPAKTTANSLSISPDEKRIAYVTLEDEKWGVWIMPAHGGAAKEIVSSVVEIRNTVWHSDSQRLLYSSLADGTFQIFVTDADGSKPAQITFGDKDSLALDVSTDGAKILYGSSKEESDVWGVNVEKGEEFVFASDISSELWPHVAPDNKTVAFQASKNLSQGDKLHNGEILTKQTLDAQPIQLVKNSFLPTWSPDGKQLAFMRVSGDTYNLWTIKATGGEEKQLTTSGLLSVEFNVLPYNRTQESSFSWSPDSSKVAYISNRSGQRNVWLVSANGSNDVQLTNNNDANLFLFCPLWSSDGKRIAYSAKLNNPSADGKIISTASVIDIETKTSRAVLQSENFQRLLGWTATEKELLLATINRKYGTELPTEVSLIQVNVETGEQRTIAKLESAYLYNIHLSFDRKVIAFAAHRDDKDNVWVMPASGGEAKKLTHNNDTRLYFSSLAWSPDGRSLYFGKQSRFSLLSMITNLE